MNRETEIARYVECYRKDGYGMGAKRKKRATEVIGSLAGLGARSLLDVGAGRGELSAIAQYNDMLYRGVDPVPYLATDEIITGEATRLPFAPFSFDVVACLDVLEHLVEEDIRLALLEMRRVAIRFVFLTASEQPSFYGSPDGKDLHISKRPLAEWQALFEDVFAFSKITPLGMVGVSPGWLIEV